MDNTSDWTQIEFNQRGQFYVDTANFPAAAKTIVIPYCSIVLLEVSTGVVLNGNGI